MQIEYAAQDRKTVEEHLTDQQPVVSEFVREIASCRQRAKSRFTPSGNQPSLQYRFSISEVSFFTLRNFDVIGE